MKFHNYCILHDDGCVHINAVKKLLIAILLIIEMQNITIIIIYELSDFCIASAIIFVINLTS